MRSEVVGPCGAELRRLRNGHAVKSMLNRRDRICVRAAVRYVQNLFERLTSQHSSDPIHIVLSKHQNNYKLQVYLH